MQVLRKIDKAASAIAKLSAQQRSGLQERCAQIQQAQSLLNRVGEPYFRQCLQQCRGLCCRNIHVDDIITLLDFVFILGSDGGLLDGMRQCAERQDLFSADCVFLQNGVGPCMFHDHAKPERCVISFCSETGAINREIRTVRKKFSALARFLALRQPLLWLA
jgi:hypothetical protein